MMVRVKHGETDVKMRYATCDVLQTFGHLAL